MGPPQFVISVPFNVLIFADAKGCCNFIILQRLYIPLLCAVGVVPTYTAPIRWRTHTRSAFVDSYILRPPSGQGSKLFTVHDAHAPCGFIDTRSWNTVRINIAGQCCSLYVLLHSHDLAYLGPRMSFALCDGVPMKPSNALGVRAAVQAEHTFQRFDSTLVASNSD